MQASFQVGVVSVFYLIVCATLYILGDFTPARRVLDIETKYQTVFLKAPLLFHDIRVKVMVPSFAALLSDAAWELLGDLGPIFRAILLHCFSQDLIFLSCPGRHRHVTFVIQFQPALVTLYFRFSSYLTNAVPCIGSVLFNRFAKFDVLNESLMLKDLNALGLTSSYVHCILFLTYFVPD